ncbi:hypothetical protein SAMN04490356_0606 [Streptomyces melanosporofaciens]|uniref:RmlD substrate binding domain-containing protein n=1 Tax=Streptomyces melanosporofaciens TaxID=67327 RepID=A0A1H4KCZ5_STRMJ|nr:hypothetical protein SAMN04490356_0606 [Streptomyces melanosporofaciens]
MTTLIVGSGSTGGAWATDRRRRGDRRGHLQDAAEVRHPRRGYLVGERTARRDGGPGASPGYWPRAGPSCPNQRGPRRRPTHTAGQARVGTAAGRPDGAAGQPCPWPGRPGARRPAVFLRPVRARIGRGPEVLATRDHWTTPALVDDVVAVTSALLTVQGPPLLHRGKSGRVSHYAWAQIIARAAGAPDPLSVPESRTAGWYASRAPEQLPSKRPAGRRPRPRAPVRGVREAARNLLHAPRSAQTASSDRRITQFEEAAP